MNALKKILSIALMLAVILSLTAAEAKNPFEQNRDKDLMRKLAVKSSDKGGVLLFSDSPEKVLEDGILYSDVVKGDARLLFYHLNGTNADKKIAVVVENLSSKKNTVEISRGVVSEPSANYLEVGKEVQTEYMQETFNYSLYLEPDGKDLLIEDVSNHLVALRDL